MENVTILGFIAAAFTTFSLLPQTLKVFRTREAKDLSLVTLIMLVIGFALWMVYGIYRSDVVLIYANIVTLSFGLTLITLKLRHG